MGRAAALAMVDQFEARTGRAAFPNLSGPRQRFASLLRDRITMPSSIDQGRASLCGPAVYVYNLARKNPDAYASYAINLYEKGSAWIGHMKVAPSADCKNARPVGVTDVDWVTLASLRDSSNKIADYDESSDQAAGITGPRALAAWFSACGYFSGTMRDVSFIRDKKLSTLVKAHQQRVAGGLACLFVGANIVKGQSRGKMIPDHWVGLASEVTVDGISVGPLAARGTKVDSDKGLRKKMVSFQMFTWGGIAALSPVSVEEFLDYFYGYVGAK